MVKWRQGDKEMTEKEKTSRFIQLTQAVFLISLVQIKLGWAMRDDKKSIR